jgi:hypothetical protein
MKKTITIVASFLVILIMASTSWALSYGPDFFRVNDPVGDGEAIEVSITGSGLTFGVYDTTTLTEAILFDDATMPDFASASFNISGGWLTGEWYDTNAPLSAPVGALTTTPMGNEFGFFFDTGSSKVYTDASRNPLGAEFIITEVYGTGNAQGAFVTFEDFEVTVKVTDVSPVPEPATMVLLGVGLICVAGVSRRKMNK